MSELLADYWTLEEFAQQVKRSPRTFRRWMNKPDGLPYVKLGKEIYIHKETAKDWLLNGMVRPNPRRGK